MTSESENPNRRAAPQSAPISGVVDRRPTRDRIDWEEAKRLYVKEHLSFAEIARRLGYTAKRLRLGLADRGVVSRTLEKPIDRTSIAMHNSGEPLVR